MAEHFGKCLGYDSEPCPNCGRVRLENYENGKQVCEKCGWCPQNNDYVDPYEDLKEQDYIAFVAGQRVGE